MSEIILILSLIYKMLIYDSHLHLDENLQIEDGIIALVSNLNSAGIAGGFVIHLLSQKFSFTDFSNAISLYPEFKVFRNIDPREELNLISLEINQAKDFGAIGIKLHPRQQEFNLMHSNIKPICELAQDLHLIINICAFDDGSWHRLGLNYPQFQMLADLYPKVNFIWSHAGGHRVIDFMFMARRTGNVFLDTSFTPNYFFRGSVKEDLLYVIESLPNRYLFGTDPQANEYEAKVKDLFEYFKNLQSDTNQLFNSNYKHLVSLYE